MIELVAQLALELTRDVMHEAQILGEERISGCQVAAGEGFPIGSGFHVQLQRRDGEEKEELLFNAAGAPPGAAGHDGMNRLMTARMASAAGEP